MRSCRRSRSPWPSRETWTCACRRRRRALRGSHEVARRSSRGFRLQAEGPRGWLYGVGVAAATLIAVLFVAPAVRKPDATVSAAEILAKSASQLSATVTGGVELLEYELVLDGVPKEMMPDGADGTYRVQQAIDHNVPGRFRFASFGPDGSMLTSIAQDPQAQPPRHGVHGGRAAVPLRGVAAGEGRRHVAARRWSACTWRRRSR